MFDLGWSELLLIGIVALIVVGPKDLPVLFRNIGRLLSRGHMLEAVWGRTANLATRTVDTHVSRVRSKLNLRPESGFRLVPTYNYGYRLEQLDDEAAP